MVAYFQLFEGKFSKIFPLKLIINFVDSLIVLFFFF